MPEKIRKKAEISFWSRKFADSCVGNLFCGSVSYANVRKRYHIVVVRPLGDSFYGIWLVKSVSCISFQVVRLLVNLCG